MANIIQRLVKGSPLTLAENDANFVNLNNELATKSTPATVAVQIDAAISIEAAARVSGDNAEVTARNSAIAAGDAATLVSAKNYSDGVIVTEVANRNNAITTAVTGLKGGVTSDGDTLGKLRALISGTNSGTNTGDETTATIKSKLGITVLSGSNTGDQTNITGNAGTATKLQTARTINGVVFDGTANINLNAVDSTDRIASSLLGVANGVATLDSAGLVPASQLPSYVDDVIEAANQVSFPATGEAGKIYVAKDTNKTYRWSGSTYVYITSGAVDSVAGKTGVVTLTKTDVGLGNVDNTADTNKPVSTAQATAISNAQSNAEADATTKASAAQAAAIAASAPLTHVGATGTAHGVATTSTAGFLSAADKTKLDGIATGATANVGTVTAVTATGAISSTGGATPVISIRAASTSDDGTLSAADKVKLNNIAGTNTGDETTASIKSKLGITTLSGSNTGDQTTITGNAGTATKLQTARSINGVAFDGTTNITVNAVDATARIASSEKGAVNGVATLGSDGKIPTAQLPDSGGAVDSVAGKTGVVTLTKDDVGLDLVDNTSDSFKNSAVATLENKTISGCSYTNSIDVIGSVRNSVNVVPLLDINCSSGNYFKKSINTSSTFTFSNIPANRAYSFILELRHISGTVTWPNTVRWPDGVTPSLTTNKIHLFVFVTDDGGASWRGSANINYVI